MPASVTVISCPGKVLMTGGYLILDRRYCGSVVATSSRFYTVVQPDQVIQDLPHVPLGPPPRASLTEETDPLVNPSNVAEDPASPPLTTEPSSSTATAAPAAKERVVRVCVKSPQFMSAKWIYHINISSQGDDCTLVPQRDETLSPASLGQPSKNPFVQIAVESCFKFALAYGYVASDDAIRITVVGDNEFYSQTTSTSSSSTSRNKRFNVLQETLTTVHKTGLGSSAAMVTSLCSAIVLHLLPYPSRAWRSEGEPDRVLLHNLAQYVHSLAQGKVGSGFDVSAAMFGNHGYSRFSEACIARLFNGGSVSGSMLKSVLDPEENPEWKQGAMARVERFELPPQTLLMLGDVAAGSHTPSMVGQVMAWKQANPEQGERVWKEQGEANDRLRAALMRMAQQATLSPHQYAAILSRTSPMEPPWMRDVLESGRRVRQGMKQLGELAGVAVEPDSQTALLDACERISGVLACGVPGGACNWL